MTPTSRERYTILVLDDDPSVLECYAKLLRRAGYRTMTSGDPRSVLAGGTDLAPVDLIVLDYKMPGMDGLTFLAEVRRKECRARCVLISAFVNDGVRQQANLLGVDRVLEKPVAADLLRGALADLLPNLGPAAPPGA
jgi:CheY-like chemotaxis protein